MSGKKLKKKEKQKHDTARNVTQVRTTEQLLKYLENYGDSESIQSNLDAFYDPQLKSLSLPLSVELGKQNEGTIFDIGSGKGILLNKLTQIAEFADSNWLYFAVDYEEQIEKVLELSATLRIHRRCEALPLDAFYSAWPLQKIAPKPYISVIRNVFHEMDIEKTSQLLSLIISNFDENDTLFVQDLEVFPVGERGNACWLSKFFKEVLESIGFMVNVVEEPTAKGNRWFTLRAALSSQITRDIESVKKAVLRERTNQYIYWNELGWLKPDDGKLRDFRVAQLDFDLQCAALHKELRKYDPLKFPALSNEQQNQITRKSIARQLLAVPNVMATSIEPPRSFRDRKQEQNKLETFLRDDASLMVIRGGQKTGKTILAYEVLSHRAYEKQPVSIDIQYSSSVWNILEQFLHGTGVRLSFNLIKDAKNINFRELLEDLHIFIKQVADKIVIVVDHFERLLNFDDQVADTDIRDFLSLLVNAPGAKIIITTRREPNMPFINTERFTKQSIFPMGRFPEGDYVKNVLDDFVDRSKIGLDEYPSKLFEAIDRHPFLAVIAGIFIKKYGVANACDDTFLDLVRNRLRDELLNRIVDENSLQTIEILSLVRIPIPRPMLSALSSQTSVQAAEQDCLVYRVHDKSRNDLIAGIGAFRKYSKDIDDLELTGEFVSDMKDEEMKRHKNIALWYYKLYREDREPRWIREFYYHTMLSGDVAAIEDFGVVYRDEVYWCGEYWFLKLKKYKEALWAFRLVHKLGMINDSTEMRLASCLMRSGEFSKIKEGEQLYGTLVDRYKDDYRSFRFKTSYISALLYLKEYQKALDKLQEFNIKEDHSDWITHEYGRSYLGLHRYNEAVQAFERQLVSVKDVYVYDVLARAYHKLGDSDNVERVLAEGMKKHPEKSRLKLTFAAHLVLSLSDSYKDAYPILEELYGLYPSDGRILQQYCKLLCRDDRVPEARKIWEKEKDKIRYEGYRIPILVEILIGEKKWKPALELLKNISGKDEHSVGLKKKVYLRWARAEMDPQLQANIALQGLEVPMAPSLQNNIPIMVTSARLSLIADERDEFLHILKIIEGINPKIADMLAREDDEPYYWEEDIDPGMV